MAEEPERKPPRAPLGGRLAWWPFAAALAAAIALVLAVVLVNVFAGGGTTGSRQQGTGLTSSGAVACPEFYEQADPTDTEGTKGTKGAPWVPARPAGVSAKKKLVPKLHPTHVTVCEYLGHLGKAAKSLRLTGQHELSGDLDKVVPTLRAAPAAGRPRPCATYLARSDANRYLIGLRYAEAIVWVSAPGNHCDGAANGRFSTARNFSAVAAASFAAGTWVATPN